jgi:hypothetical protein
MVFAVLIGVIVVLFVIQTYTRVAALFGSGTADLALQSDTRLLFDHLQSDLAAGVLAATGKESIDNFDWKADRSLQSLQIFRLKKDPRERHAADPRSDRPQYPGYPGFREDGEATVQRLPVLRELYEMEPGNPQENGHRIYRTEEDGDLVRTETVPVCEKVPAFIYRFERKSSGQRTLLAARVSSLVLIPLAFVPRSQTPSGAPVGDKADPKDLDLRFAVWNKKMKCAQLHQIAGLGVRFLAQDLKTGAPGGEGRIELVSKFWMEERSAAFRFNRAFSSVDEHLW